MQFLILQSVSVLVGTVIFLLHATNVNSKADALQTDIDNIKSNLDTILDLNEELRTEVTTLREKLKQIHELSA